MKKIICSLLVILITIASINLFAKKITKPTERAVYHANKGVKYLNQGDLERAETEIKTAIELSPEFVDAYNNLGIVYKLKGDLYSAKSYFEKAIKLDKHYASAISHLSMVYLELGDIDNALKYGKKAVKVGTPKPITHFNLALVYLEKNRKKPGKNFDNYAEKQLSITTELDPNMFEAHKTLARLYKKQGKYEQAAIRYRLALGNHPEDKESWKELAEVYKALGNHMMAEKALRMAENGQAQGQDIKDISKQQIDASIANIKLGTELMNQGKYEKAVEEFTKATIASPKNANAYNTLGSALLFIGENKMQRESTDAKDYIERSIPAFKKALELNPTLVDASYNIGYAFYRLGKSDEAEKIWLETLSLNSKHERTLYNLGILYNDKKNRTKANDYLCKFIQTADKQLSDQKEKALNLIKTNGGKCQN